MKAYNTGVKINAREIDFNSTPTPEIVMTTPETIFGGGLKGTGVPLDLKKCNSDHIHKKDPSARKGMAMIMFNGDMNISGSPSN
jgi:hypothetical protein